jgi:hypothetical protein
VRKDTPSLFRPVTLSTRARRRPRGRSVLATTLLAAVALVGAPSLPARGGVPAPVPSTAHAQAIDRTRAAAQAVLDQSGTEHCLRGKLTNALLGLSASCARAGAASPLCELADRVVVTTGWTATFMQTTARQLLALAAPPAGPHSQP